MFDSTKEDLRDILRKADEGKLQLPDFQRDYVWGDDDVRGLIASIAKGFPIGALLTLQAGSEIRFKPRLLAGVPEQTVEPEELLLDGQQRITSLYQSIYSRNPVRTRARKTCFVDRFYYLDIRRAILGDADIFDADCPRARRPDYPRQLRQRRRARPLHAGVGVRARHVSSQPDIR